MNRVKKGLFIVLLCLWAACIGNCGLLDFNTDEGRFTYHRVNIRNNSDHPVFVEVRSISQVLDTTGGNAIVEPEPLDTTYRLQQFNHARLYNLERPSAEREQLDFDEMVDNLSHLRIYRVIGTDTLDANLDWNNTGNWEIYTDDVFYSYFINHFYNLLVTESHFD